ncbi:MAG: heavy-metal-associated domain-containing protein [Propionibacteriaceae bacterium]|nr:heavy-metal-associated domain-containing protein [Propionibacteriaceae bacterium]
MITHYTVTGMSCEHCRHHVTTEVGSIPGVQTVAVDLASGGMDVTSAAPVPFEAIQAAVHEAGDYEVQPG